MPYIAHLTQAGEGCGHMIDCGCKVIRLESETSDGAVAEMHQQIRENYHGESALEQCVIYQVAGHAYVDLSSLYDEIEREEKLSRAQAAMEKATRELERAKQQLKSMG
jgi:hypothetical protein